MLKGEYIELTVTKVQGGLVDTDKKVYRADVESYLPAALKALILKKYYADKNENRADGILERSLPIDFITTVPDVEVLKDEIQDRPYIELPFDRISFGTHDGVELVGAKGGCIFTKIRREECRNLEFDQQYMPDEIFYWVEDNRVYLTNIPKSVEKILVRMIKCPSNVEYDEELQVPAGYEAELLEMLFNYFVVQRQLPKDYINDTIDVQ